MCEITREEMRDPFERRWVRDGLRTSFDYSSESHLTGSKGLRGKKHEGRAHLFRVYVGMTACQQIREVKGLKKLRY